MSPGLEGGGRQYRRRDGRRRHHPASSPNGSAAAIAIVTAKSMLGTQYVWGGADPSGFDCSGSSAMMAAMLPHVSRADLVPGDLVFFYTPVSHVGLYIGGGTMIDTIHPGAGGEVNYRNIDSFGFFAYGGRMSG